MVSSAFQNVTIITFRFYCLLNFQLVSQLNIWSNIKVNYWVLVCNSEASVFLCLITNWMHTLHRVRRKWFPSTLTSISFLWNTNNVVNWVSKWRRLKAAIYMPSRSADLCTTLVLVIWHAKNIGIWWSWMPIKRRVQFAKQCTYFHLPLSTDYALVAENKETVGVDVSSDLVYNRLW